MAIQSAKRRVRQGRAIWFKDKVLGTCVRLKYPPSGDKKPDSTLGFDKGSMFDGYTVSSKNFQVNVEFVHVKMVKDKNWLRKAMEKRRMYRRTRRSRLRHRRARFTNRIGNKVSKTTHYYVQHNCNMIQKLSELFGCQTLVMEDIRFNHARSNKGKGFSPIEQGKNMIREFVVNGLGLDLIEVDGRDTTTERKRYFSIDAKSKDKSEKSFYAHCADSFVLTRFHTNYRLKSSLVTFVEQVKPIKRRDIYQEKARYKDKKEYFRYAKGGVKMPFVKFSRIVKIRTKQTDDRANHGPWDYEFTVGSPCQKKFLKLYGGRCKNGVSKYWDKNHYRYVTTEIVRSLVAI